jgi:galactokinase/mevalonate kinase-like predicted kinase
MSNINSSNAHLSDDEWNELVNLKNLINQNPASVHPDKMEQFTNLLVRSWDAKRDLP